MNLIKVYTFAVDYLPESEKKKAHSLALLLGLNEVIYVMFRVDLKSKGSVMASAI